MATTRPKADSTFCSFVDEKAYIFNNDKATCYEISNLGVSVIRTFDSKHNNAKIMQSLKIKLPQKLSISVANNLYCLWISPDEYWLLHEYEKKEWLYKKQQDLAKDIILIDNYDTYGLLKLSGKKYKILLARLMSYDIYNLTPNKVVSTTLQQAPVVIFNANIDNTEEDAIHLLVRHSFADYVANLLKDCVKRI